jgi:hypothetical protein
MPKKVTDIDLGYSKTIDQLIEIGKRDVTIGVHAKDNGPYENSPLTTAYIASVHEFGRGNNPERSFLRATIEENKNKYAELEKKLIGRIIDGKITAEQALELIGQQAKSDVQTKIRTLRTPPNTAETIKRKGSSNPLIDTGQLRQSIDYVVNKAD